jgi:phosphopantothenoylcysteine decarboxylase / phosphopantothenate---cysteine ligase
LSDNSSIFLDKKIVLGITASIAAYKAAYICSRLVKSGASVIPVMTLRAENFINPITFSSLSGNETITGQFDNSGDISHITLARSSDAFLIAPASADVICKIARGVCDDFLTTAAVAAKCPVLIAPAMNTRMYLDGAVREAIEMLAGRGKFRIIGPAEGDLACGEKGPGRMEEEDRIIDSLAELLNISHSLKGKKVLITAGGTREYIDMVRFISNSSSGKMGFALAEEAYFRGAEKVILVSAAGKGMVPYGAEVVHVEDTSSMKEAVMNNLEDADIIIMAAAVSDIIPVKKNDKKIPKKSLISSIRFKLNENILDILAKNKKNGQFLIGFAAESDYNVSKVIGKFSGRNVDMVVANDISGKDKGIGSDYNQVDIIIPGKEPVRIPRNKKRIVAAGIWDEIIKQKYEIIDN